MRVLLACSHAGVRRGLESLLDWEGFRIVAGCADSGEALRQAEATRPEVAVLDLALPRVNGLDVARLIMQISPETRTILLTHHPEERFVREALRAGVHGYVLKRQAMSDIVQAIQEVHRGRVFVSPVIPRAVARVGSGKPMTATISLTPIEREVLRLVVGGKSTAQAAERLEISVAAVESHLARVQKKLGVERVAGLVRGAGHRGLLQP